MIGIRADANETIATGHIMRCMAIADELEALGEKTVFLIADQFPVKILENRGYPWICLDQDWEKKEGELPHLLEVLKEKEIHHLLVDSYQATARYLKLLQEHVKVIYIDDLSAFPVEADLVVNYALGADPSDYVHQRGKVLLGREYTPIRKAFAEKKIQIRDKGSSILFTTGGSDPLGLSSLFLEQWRRRDPSGEISIHMVAGSFYTNIEALREGVEHAPGLILHEKVQQMEDVMVLCDLAVSAGGTTLSELAAMGVPTVCFAMADNQLKVTQMYEKEAGMFSMGDIRIAPMEGMAKIWELCQELLMDGCARRKAAQKASDCVDGLGSARIAREIMLL